jgi:alkylation response protein AidB-like acyl-CoA dehydrogenase
MDLNYAPEDLAFRQTTRRWFAERTPKVEPKTLAERKAWHRTMYDAGYVGMLWPKEYGGRGATPMQQAIVQDEMARASAPPPINGLGIGFIGPTIIVHGTEAQKQRYLQKILTAEEIWCQLYSEPNAGSDLAGLKTRADDAGDHFVVNGQKIWTSSGPIADWGILLARTDAKAPKHKGISCFLFNMRQPGVDVRPLKQITGSSLFSEVFMTNARAEKSDLIGKLAGGWEIAQTTLGYEPVLLYTSPSPRDA